MAAITGGMILAGLAIADQVANVVSVGLQVNDALTPTLVEVQNTADFTGDSIQRLSLRLDTAFAAMTNPVQTLKYGMSELLRTFANPGSLDLFTVIGTGFDYLQDKLGAAASIQTTMLNTSAAIANELGLTLAQSNQLAENSIASLSKAAAALPGETADYANIYRQLASQIAKNNPGDTEAFNKQATSMSTKLGVLASTSGMDSTEVGRQSARFLSGTVSIGEFRNLQLGENPLVMNALIEEMTKLGKSVDEWTALSLKERVTIYEKVLESAIPKELTDSFEGTVEAIFAGWDTMIFDPTTGLLGVLRRVESLGGRNLLEAFQGILQTFDRMQGVVQDLLKSAGLTTDPMEVLINLFDYVNVQLNNLESFLEGKMGTDDIIQTIQGIGEDIGDWVVKAVDFVVDFLGNLSKSISGDDIGRIMSQIFWTIEELTSQILNNVDWIKIGQIWAEFETQKQNLEMRIFMESLKMIPLRMTNAIERWTAGLLVWWNRDIMGTLKRISDIFERTVQGIENALGFGLGRKKDGSVNALGATTGFLNPFASRKARVEGFEYFKGKIFGTKEKEDKKDTNPLSKQNLPTIKNKINNNQANSNTNNINVTASTNANPEDIATAVMNSLNQQYSLATQNYG